MLFHLFVFLGFFFTCQNTQSTLGQSDHFSFTRIGNNRSDPAYIGLDAVNDILTMGNTAGEDDGINVTLEYSCQSCDILECW